MIPEVQSYTNSSVTYYAPGSQSHIKYPLPYKVAVMYTGPKNSLANLSENVAFCAEVVHNCYNFTLFEMPILSFDQEGKICHEIKKSPLPGLGLIPYYEEKNKRFQFYFYFRHYDRGCTCNLEAPIERVEKGACVKIHESCSPIFSRLELNFDSGPRFTLRYTNNVHDKMQLLFAAKADKDSILSKIPSDIFQLIVLEYANVMTG